MEKKIALVIDDEPDIRELLGFTLRRMNIEVVEASTIQEAKQRLESHSFSFCLTDMRLPDGEGLEFVEYLQAYFPGIPVAVLTAYGSIDAAVRALKAGAFDFVCKPIELRILRDLVHTALRVGETGATSSRTEHAIQLLGHSKVMDALRQKIQKLARSQAPIHIYGPSGSGKELVARLIHLQGPRADKPFIPVNCGAIPNELMESELFGHKRGSFTGAIENKEGLFQAAQGGTLFLDEVADLPMSMQVKLLRAIQEKAIRPVGAPQEIPVDVRILSATHQNLQGKVAANEFRQDLFYRINVIGIEVPSLKERKEDIEELSEYILKKVSKEHKIPKPKVSKAALHRLLEYSFPGNVRELENILERALTLCEGSVIQSDDLQLNVVSEKLPSDVSEEDSLEGYLDDLEKQRILNALEECHWNRSATARKLGITFRALRYRLKKLGIT